MDSFLAVRKDMLLCVPKMKGQGSHRLLQERAPTLLNWGEFSKFGKMMGEFLYRSMDLWWVPRWCLDPISFAEPISTQRLFVDYAFLVLITKGLCSHDLC